ncbi:MAG: hypothetical protein GY870_04090 [archaeon]|nr:hypothetical protein [archaeon]
MSAAIDENALKKYKKAGKIITKAGGTPFPVSDALIELLSNLIEEKDLDFILAFKRKKSQTMEQLKESIVKAKLDYSEEIILEKIERLAKKGVIFNQPNSKGIMVFRLLPLVNVGSFEYTFMGSLDPNKADENKKLAALFTKVFDDLRDSVQSDYDNMVSFMSTLPAVDRTVPVYKNFESGKEIEINKTIDVPDEVILPAQKVEEIINKFDEIAVAHCFCRHHQYIEGNTCKQVDPTAENCFTFGKSARHVTKHGFGRMVSKEEALEILYKTEELGLVHKAYHPNFDTSRDETSICNCCNCCCGNSPSNAIAVIVNSSNFLSNINQENCVGCGTCVEKCHTGAIILNSDDKAERDENQCIGCGVCASFCPEEAISLTEVQRTIKIPPPRKK